MLQEKFVQSDRPTPKTQRVLEVFYFDTWGENYAKETHEFEGSTNDRSAIGDALRWLHANRHVLAHAYAFRDSILFKVGDAMRYLPLTTFGFAPVPESCGD